MKVATYYKTLNELEYWTSLNTTTRRHCDSKDKAKELLKQSPVPQELLVLNTIVG